jgi:hypothetical protein
MAVGQRDAAPGRMRTHRQAHGSSVRARADLPSRRSHGVLRSPAETRLRLSGTGLLFADHRRPCRRFGPVRSPSQLSYRPPSSPSAPPPEAPGFGAFPIARLARVKDRDAGLPADLRLVPEPGAGGEIAVALGYLLAAKRWIAVTSSVVCWIVKGPSPHSVPIRSPFGSILRGCGSNSFPIRSLLSSSPCLRSGVRLGNSDSCRQHRGTRREPSGLPSTRGGGGPGVAALRPLRRTLLESGSASRSSPIQGRATASEAFRLGGRESGELLGSAGQEVVAKARHREEEGSAGLDSEDASGDE